MNIPLQRRPMAGAHLCLVVDDHFGGHDHATGHRGEMADGDQAGMVAARCDGVRTRAEYLASLGARVTVLRSSDITHTSLTDDDPVRNFGLREDRSIEADRSGIEWIDLDSRGLRGTRELAGHLDRLRPDLVHLDPGWLIAGAAATRLLRMPSVVVSIDDATATQLLGRSRLRKVLSVLLAGPNSRAIFPSESISQRCVQAGLVRPGRAVVLTDGPDRTVDVYAACLGYPPVTLTAT